MGEEQPSPCSQWGRINRRLARNGGGETFTLLARVRSNLHLAQKGGRKNLPRGLHLARKGGGATFTLLTGYHPVPRYVTSRATRIRFQFQRDKARLVGLLFNNTNPFVFN